MTKCAKLKPLTRYYFQKFSLTATQPQLHLVEFLFGNDVDQLSTADNIMEKLLGTMPRCTPKECEWLARSQPFRTQMFAAQLLFSQVVGQSQQLHSTTAALENLRYTSQCLIHVVKVRPAYQPTTTTTPQSYFYNRFLFGRMKFCRVLKRRPNDTMC